MRPALGRAVLLGVLTAVAALAFATNALAVSGTRIHVAELPRFGSPAVAVDSAGTAYIAWPNGVRLPKEGDLVEYCVLPANASACEYRNHLRLEGGEEPYIGKVRVLVDGTTVILLATDDYGVDSKYTPVQEWQSTNGGASFTQVIGNKSVANYEGGSDSAIIVPGSNALGIGAGQPSFDEFSLTSPIECDHESCKDFATLQAEKNKIEHPLSDLGGAFASDLTPGQQGVLGVYPTFSRENQCNGESSSVTDYVYGSGAQEANNSYDIDPGQPKSAWKKELSFGGCEVDDVAVAGGPSGLGVVENDTTRGYTVYQRFNQATEEFEPAYTTIATEDESQPSLSQDGSGGLYLTYDVFCGINLAYSSTGGASWTGPAQIYTGQCGEVGSLSSAVGSGGQGWAVWTHEESIYAQQFVASDAVPPVTTPISTPISTPKPTPTPPNSNYTIGSIVSNSNGTVTITFVPTQSGEATLVVTVPTASIASASATTAKSKKCKHGQIKIKGKCLPSTTTAGRTSASGTAGVPLKLTVNLSSKIRALLKKGKTVHLTATLTYTSSLGGTPTTHTYNLTVKGHKPKHKK
jgi:hypothetical protein